MKTQDKRAKGFVQGALVILKGFPVKQEMLVYDVEALPACSRQTCKALTS